MKDDNEAMQNVFAKYTGYYSHLCSIAQLCIVNKEDIEEYWIVETENKLNRRIGEGEIREGCELRGERAGITDFEEEGVSHQRCFNCK